MDSNERLLTGALPVSPMLYGSPTGIVTSGGSGGGSWAFYMEEFYKQYHQHPAVVAACPSPGMASMASPIGWPATPSLHGAPTYIASPGSPLPPSFSFMSTGLASGRQLPRLQQQQQRQHCSFSRLQSVDAEVQCSYNASASPVLSPDVVEAGTQTEPLSVHQCQCQLGISQSAVDLVESQDEDENTVAWEDSRKQDRDEDLDDVSNEDEDIEVVDSKDYLDISASPTTPLMPDSTNSLVNDRSKLDNGLMFDHNQVSRHQHQQQQSQHRRQIGIVRGRPQQSSTIGPSTSSDSSQPIELASAEATSLTMVEAKSVSRGQRQWDILCAVAALLQQVDLLQLDNEGSEHPDESVSDKSDKSDSDVVNSVDNLGCRYDTRPVNRVDLSPGTNLIPDSKDCEQLVARIEALWRRIQQSRLKQQRYRSGGGGVTHPARTTAPRHRHRSDAPVRLSASTSAANSDGGDAFSPYASSVHMLAFCAAEQRQRSTVSQSGCPTIDRIPVAATSPAFKSTKLASCTADAESYRRVACEPATYSSFSSAADNTAVETTVSSANIHSSGSSIRKRRHPSVSGEDQSGLGLADNGPPTPELRSCQLAENDLRDGQRVLVAEADLADGATGDGGGVWYSGVLREVRPPDVYRVSLNGSPRSRHQYFTREELLCQAVLEIRPSSRAELPAGSRVCAYWSGSLTALYPGTVRSNDGKRVCSTSTEAGQDQQIEDIDDEEEDASQAMVYIEFDDNDSRWIPLDRVRMLPPGLPVQRVAMSGSPQARRRRQSSAASAVSTESATAAVSASAIFEWADAGRRRGRRQRHRALLRNGEPISVGDAVMFKSSSADRPFFGRVVDMWEEDQPAAGAGSDDEDDNKATVAASSKKRRMWVEAAWFYQPREMPDQLARRFRREQGRALFISGHRDRNEARTILRKLPLVSYADSRASSRRSSGGEEFFLAGEYDASGKRIVSLDADYEAALLARQAEKKRLKKQKKRLLAEAGR